MATSAPSEMKNETKNETKKKSGKLLVLAGILLLAGANVGFWLYREKLRLPVPVAGAAAVASARAAVPLENVTLDPFLVNLDGDQAYLKVAMTLSIRGTDRSRENSSSGSGGTDLARSALVRDTILEALSSQDADALLTVGGKAALKKTLKTALEGTVPSLGLDHIYFTEFLVQR
jgi:flagellar basal body-associated protein FliL